MFLRRLIHLNCTKHWPGHKSLLKLILSIRSSSSKSCRIASETNSLNTWENLFTPWKLFSYVMPTAGKIKTENIEKKKKREWNKEHAWQMVEINSWSSLSASLTVLLSLNYHSPIILPRLSMKLCWLLSSDSCFS